MPEFCSTCFPCSVRTIPHGHVNTHNHATCWNECVLSFDGRRVTLEILIQGHAELCGYAPLVCRPRSRRHRENHSRLRRCRLQAAHCRQAPDQQPASPNWTLALVLQHTPVMAAFVWSHQIVIDQSRHIMPDSRCVQHAIWKMIFSIGIQLRTLCVANGYTASGRRSAVPAHSPAKHKHRSYQECAAPHAFCGAQCRRHINDCAAQHHARAAQ